MMTHVKENPLGSDFVGDTLDLHWNQHTPIHMTFVFINGDEVSMTPEEFRKLYLGEWVAEEEV